MAFIDGDPAVSGSIFSFQQMNRMLRNFRLATPPGSPEDGSLYSDSDDDILYHKATAAFEQIVQTDVPITAGVVILKDLQVNEAAYFDAQQTAVGDGATTIDWGLGNKFEFTFGALNEVFTFTAPPGPTNLILVMIQDGVGGRTATWPGTVLWPVAGTAPTLSIGGGEVDVIGCYWNGTNYLGGFNLDYQ